MAYINFYLLDKEKKVVKEYIHKPCFYLLGDSLEFIRYNKAHYILFPFGEKQVVTKEEARKYFLFIKSIPEFKELMPKSCTAMAKKGEIILDLHKFNGTKIFTILTLVRAVIEDPAIVRKVIKFNRKFKYSISNYAILKMCGSVLQTNSNHWITPIVSITNINNMFNNKEYWDDLIPAIQTGFKRKLFNTFSFDNDGYACKHPVKEADVDEVLQETLAPKKTPVQKMYDNAYLQLGF